MEWNELALEEVIAFGREVEREGVAHGDALNGQPRSLANDRPASPQGAVIANSSSAATMLSWGPSSYPRVGTRFPRLASASHEREPWTPWSQTAVSRRYRRENTPNTGDHRYVCGR